MKILNPKSKPLWYIFTVTFVIMILILVLGIFTISQLTFTRNTDNIIKIQTEAINEQIIYNFEVYTDDIMKISNQIQAKLSNVDIATGKDEVKNLFETINYLDNKYENIAVYNLSGEQLVSLNDNDNNAFDKDWLLEAILDPSVYYFSTPSLINGGYKIIISKYISLNKYHEFGVLKMELDFSNLIDIADKTNLGSNGHVSIINNNYDYIYTSKTNHFDLSNDDEIKIYENLIIGTEEIKIGDQSLLLMLNTISNTPWRIGIFININESMIVRQNFIVSTIVLSIVFIVLSSAIYYSISKRISQPLNKLKDAMSNIDQIETLDLKQVEINYPREVEILTNNFNVMINRIKSLMESIIKEKELQRKSELKALQNQINPHFLYNTLDSIVYMVENDENKSASEMIIALSKLFKISISGGRNIISVKDEIDHAKSYLFIQKIRYKDKFSYQINIENENVLKLDTMKLLLQPLIENAVYHGIDKINDTGKITINVNYENELIKFEVVDNGYGMTDEKIKELYDILDNDDLSDGVGIKNIYQRLKVYYGSKASLVISSKPDYGTKISILIPAGEIL